jgi:hypothetical protein
MLDIARNPALTSEHVIRRQIDRSVSRALTDEPYARQLLADPTLLLEDSGCSPQQYLNLRSIRADSLMDFARQAEALFWVDAGRLPSPDKHEQYELPAAASM